MLSLFPRQLAFCRVHAVEANIGAYLGGTVLKIVYPCGFQEWLTLITSIILMEKDNRC